MIRMEPNVCNRLLLSAAMLLVICLSALSLNHGFFWDTVQLGSRHATYYLTTHFSDILLPVEMDSGHIPAFGFYIALLWQIFGRSLIVSHLAILPFSIGIVWQLYRLCEKFIDKRYAGIALLMLLIDPTLLSQMTLVSPDVLLVFFFLLGANAVLENAKWLLTISVLFLFLTSMRGMMVSVCILMLDLYFKVDFRNGFKKIAGPLVRRSVLYLPALSVFIAYNSYHYYKTGWIGYHKDSPWAKSFEAVDFYGFLYNIATLGWRILDFGRIGIWLVFLMLFFLYGKLMFSIPKTRVIFYFLICLLVLLPANMIWAKDLLAHRYLMPVYLVFALLCASLLFSSAVSKKAKWFLAIVWIWILVSGNFWIYPDKIAKGWDSTLAHLPYYALRSKAIAYLDNKKIDFRDVSSFFPNVAAIDYIDLNGDHRNFDNFDGKHQYVFYSNIYNIDDATYGRISQYDVIKRFESQGVFIIIYRKL